MSAPTLEAQILGRGPGGHTAQLKLRALEGGPLLVSELLKRRVETLGVQLLDSLRRLPEQSSSTSGCRGRG